MWVNLSKDNIETLTATLPAGELATIERQIAMTQPEMTEQTSQLTKLLFEAILQWGEDLLQQEIVVETIVALFEEHQREQLANVRRLSCESTVLP